MAGILTAAVASTFSGVTPDPYFEYTTLLLPGSGTNGTQNNSFVDSSANAFPITRNPLTGPNAPTQGTFSPFSQTGWGNYFDGSGDYLATPTAQTPLTLNTDDFTLECWYYLPTQVQANTVLISSSNSSSIANALLIQLDTSTNAWGFYINGTNLLASASGRSATLNTWQHIAVTRSGSTFNFYLNGVAATGVSTSSASISVANWLIGYWYLAVHALTGYISNLRIVKGVAVYTGAFTPPTSPLAATQSAGTNISAITGTQTSLLTCQSNRFIDNSTNNFTITRNGDTRVVAFSPFNPTASWSAATYGGSGYFDGSGDYLETPSNSSFDLSTGDWTIDAWFYMNATGSYPQVWSIGNANSASYALLCDQGTKRLDILRNGGLSFTIATIDLSTWYHVAIVCQSGTVRAYLNGVQTGGTSTSLPPSGSVKFSVGGRNYSDIGAGSYWNGYISSVRVVKGTAVYTGNFTPPTAPLTAITNTSLLLNFTNAGIYDATSKNDLETVADAQISNTTAKWGSTSIKFDGTGDYLKGNQATTDLYTFSGDFTIETWVYSTSSAIVGGGYPTIFATSAFNGTGIGLKIQSAGGSGTTGCACVWYNNTQILTGTSNIADSAWHHVAVTRSGSTIRLFVDGTQQTSATNSSTFTCASGYPLTAADSSSAGNLTGYIQDLRITKGYARYTANFTAPTAAFPTL